MNPLSPKEAARRRINDLRANFPEVCQKCKVKFTKRRAMIQHSSQCFKCKDCHVWHNKSHRLPGRCERFVKRIGKYRSCPICNDNLTNVHKHLDVKHHLSEAEFKAAQLVLEESFPHALDLINQGELLKERSPDQFNQDKGSSSSEQKAMQQLPPIEQPHQQIRQKRLLYPNVLEIGAPSSISDVDLAREIDSWCKEDRYARRKLFNSNYKINATVENSFGCAICKRPVGSYFDIFRHLRLRHAPQLPPDQAAQYGPAQFQTLHWPNIVKPTNPKFLSWSAYEDTHSSKLFVQQYGKPVPESCAVCEEPPKFGNLESHFLLEHSEMKIRGDIDPYAVWANAWQCMSILDS